MAEEPHLQSRVSRRHVDRRRRRRSHRRRLFGFSQAAAGWIAFGLSVIALSGGVAALVLSLLARERYVASSVESRVSDTDSDAREPLRSAA